MFTLDIKLHSGVTYMHKSKKS